MSFSVRVLVGFSPRRKPWKSVPSMLPVMQVGTRRPLGCQPGLTTFPSPPSSHWVLGAHLLPQGVVRHRTGWLSCHGLLRTGMLCRAAPRACSAVSCEDFLPLSQINNPHLVSPCQSVLLILHPNFINLAKMSLAHGDSVSISFPRGEIPLPPLHPPS